MKESNSSPFIAQQLAAFVEGLSLDTIPLPVIEEAKRCLLDTSGVIVAGQSTKVAESTRVHALSVYGQGKARILGVDELMHPMGAAFVNGTAGHANDFDDTSYTGIMHGSVVVFPAALALAEERGVSGRKLLEAFIVGVEVEYAIAELCTDHIYFKGWWTTGVYGTFGAAAACAKILGLDYSGIVNAISIAATYTSGMKAFFGTDAKPLGIGIAARKGMECALLAAFGLTGPADAFEHDCGFLKLLNDNKHASDFDLQLSRKWRLIDPGILFKSYPVCSAAQAAAELCQDMIRQHQLDTEQVVSVSCEVPPLVAISLIYDKPKSIRQAQFSMPFAIGSMLAFDALSLDQLKPEVLVSTQLQQQMAKVTMQVPEKLAKDASVPLRCPEGAGITMTIKQGNRFDAFLERPTGMPGNPVSDQALTAKFYDCCRYGGILAPQAKRIAERIWRLESIENLSSLID